LITIVIALTVIFKILHGSNAEKIPIITTNYRQELAEHISIGFEWDSTILSAVGAYTGEKRQILLCACSCLKTYRIRMVAGKAEPQLMISGASGVYGEEFISK